MSSRSNNHGRRHSLPRAQTLFYTSPILVSSSFVYFVVFVVIFVVVVVGFITFGSCFDWMCWCNLSQKYM